MKKKQNEVIHIPTFCSLAWNGLSINPTGAITPCCLFEKSIDDGDKPYRIYNDDIDTLFNSDFMKDIRRKMLNGEKVEACRQCYEIESHGGRSLRHISNSEEFALLESYDTESNYTPQALDLKLNNKCNLKCRMCQPKDSNLIHNEFKKVISTDSHFSNFENTKLSDPELRLNLDDIPDWENDPNFMEKFIKMLPHIRKISFVGGEPLMIDIIFQLLDKAIELDFAKNIYIAITTNLTLSREDKLLKYFTSFRRVFINISLDATGKELHYIRFPSDFSKIIKNYESLHLKSIDQKHVTYAFSMTIQFYNILYITDILRYIDEISKDGRRVLIGFTYLTFPKQLAIDVIPENVKKRALEKLEDYKSSSHLYKNSPRVKLDVDALVESLKNKVANERERLQGEFLYYTETLDKQRGQRLQDFLPELHLLLKDCNLKPLAPHLSFHQIREQGWKYAEEKKYKQAIKCFEESLLTSTGKDLDYREMAWMLMSLNKKQQAYEAYEKAYSINPKDKHVLKGLVISLVNLKRIDEAKNYLAEALVANPNDSELLRIQQRELHS